MLIFNTNNMNNKYIIKQSESGKWLNLCFSRSPKIYYVDKFTQAYMFETEEAAVAFLKQEKTDIELFELYKTKLFAQPLIWSKDP